MILLALVLGGTTLPSKKLKGFERTEADDVKGSRFFFSCVLS